MSNALSELQASNSFVIMMGLLTEGQSASLRLNEATDDDKKPALSIMFNTLEMMAMAINDAHVTEKHAGLLSDILIKCLPSFFAATWILAELRDERGRNSAAYEELERFALANSMEWPL